MRGLCKNRIGIVFRNLIKLAFLSEKILLIYGILVRRTNEYLGGVPEWLNGAVSKTVVHANVPGVRIPPPPPINSRMSWQNFVEFITLQLQQ